MGALSLAMMDSGYDDSFPYAHMRESEKAVNSSNQEPAGNCMNGIQIPRSQNGGPCFARRSDGMEAGIVRTGITPRPW